MSSYLVGSFSDDHNLPFFHFISMEGRAFIFIISFILFIYFYVFYTAELCLLAERLNNVVF